MANPLWVGDIYIVIVPLLLAVYIEITLLSIKVADFAHIKEVGRVFFCLELTLSNKI